MVSGHAQVWVLGHIVIFYYLPTVFSISLLNYVLNQAKEMRGNVFVLGL